MPNSSNPQILVANDEPSVGESLGMLLTSVGYDVALAENDMTAVSELNRMVPDLIVADLNMLQMSDIELISHVRSRYPSISIVSMSGNFHEEVIPGGITADWLYPEGQHPHYSLTMIASSIAEKTARGRASESRARPGLDS